MSELADVLERLVPELGELEGEPVRLVEGNTNRNWRARFAGRDYVVRLNGQQTDVLGIDRASELAALRHAQATGIGPRVVVVLEREEGLVSEWIDGRMLTAQEVRRPQTIAQLGAGLRTFHAGPRLPSDFDAFAIATLYREEVERRGASVPPDVGDLEALAARVRAALRGPEHDPVCAHNDLLTTNILDHDGRVVIIDWEYAGMADRYFDLGNLSVNNDFTTDDDARLLEAYWDEPATQARLAKVRLMRLLSDLREAMWGVVQHAVSTLETDFLAYAAPYFERLRLAAHSDSFERDLAVASAA